MKAGPYACAAAMGLSLLIAGCGVSSATPEPTQPDAESVTTMGTVAVPTVLDVGKGVDLTLEPECDAATRFEDVHEGAQVTLLDSEVAIIAIGELETVRPGSGATCVFKFTISGVPLGKEFYSLQVGNASRGVYTIPEDELGTYQSLRLG